MSLSFPKKAVDKPTTFHSNFSNILPKQIPCDYSKDETLLIRDINYDDRIRFPRMRTVNVYTIGSSQVSHASSKSSSASSSHPPLDPCESSSNFTTHSHATTSTSRHPSTHTTSSEPGCGSSGNISTDATTIESSAIELKNPFGNNGNSQSCSTTVNDSHFHEPGQPTFGTGSQNHGSNDGTTNTCNSNFPNKSSASSSSSSQSSSPLNYNFGNHSSTSSQSQLSLRKSSQQSNCPSVDLVETNVEKPCHEYIPAKFDLSKPLRRYSCQIVRQDQDVLQEYTTNNCIYEKDKPVWSGESKDHDSSSSSSSSLSTIVPPLSQVYQIKKPLGTPAVLRPIKSQSTLPTMQLSLSQFNYGKLSDPPPVLNAPTTQHWKPNNFTNHCMRCSVQFTSSLINFINNNIISKHHCRFCGGIFCQNCLSDTEEVILDSQGRFVVNLEEDTESNKPIKVCSKCTYMYHFLQQELMKLSASGWFFIENPNINPKFAFVPMKMVEEENRKPTGDIPNDWTWSSF